MSKRPPQSDYHQMDNSKKRKRLGQATNSRFIPEKITTARHVQGLLGDFSSPEELNTGLQHFKAFLGRCSKSDDVSEGDMNGNLRILKEWLDIQTKSTSDRDEEESQGKAFAGILQVWSYSSQNNSLPVLSTAMASLAMLVRTCSHNEELKPGGAVLCKSILQPAYLKIVYRSLVSNKDYISAPCLRLLTEINKFNLGSLCGLLHSALDFTTKNITKNLDISGGKGETTVATDSLQKPSLRTTFVRFVLSFFLFGSSSVKNEILGQRAWISPIFKYLRIDTPLVVNDVLETLSKKVLADKEIPRAVKQNVFNDWALSHIVALYSRMDVINITRAGGSEEKTVAKAVHGFLMNICTTFGNGVCYSDSGWYPPGWTEKDEKRHGGPRLHNRTLSSFILNIRPYADTLQQDLLLEIFKACPELVSDYHFNNTSFDFDPKLTSTWIGYYAFISSTIQLPIPVNFGLSKSSAFPPPMDVIIENVMPKSLGKATLARCLTHPNALIKFFVTRLLVFSFQKLRNVLSVIDRASNSMVDPSSNWAKAHFDLVEEFCKRVPDIGAVVGLINSSSKGKEGRLQKEAAGRLLADYYELMPEVALAGKFDITVALGSFLANEATSSGEDRGLRLLEMGHLLRVAKDVPDIKWWNKSVSMPFSPFVSILKACCGPTSGLPLQQIRILLHSFVSPSFLFQTEAPAPPLEALLESLSSMKDQSAVDAVLSFLDESVARCIRNPFKYIDDFAELVYDILRTKQFPENTFAVSPLTMTVVEQWKFFMQSKHSPRVKHAASSWLVRFLESSVILGENGYVLAKLCERLSASCGESGHQTGKAVFKGLKRQLDGGSSLELVNNDIDAMGIKEGLSSCLKWPRSLFDGLGKLDVSSVESVTKSIRENKIDVSLFDIAVGQRAILGVLESPKINCKDSCSALLELMKLLETILMRLREEGEASQTWENAKKMLAGNSGFVRSFLCVPKKEEDFSRYVYFSKGYSNLLATCFDDYQPILSGVCERLKSSVFGMGCYLNSHPDDSGRFEVISTYKIIIDQLFSHGDTLDYIKNIIEDDTSELQFGVLGQLLYRLSLRNEYLLTDGLEKLLAINNAPKLFCDALVAYINSTPKDRLESFDPKSCHLNFGAELHEWSISLDTCLIRRVESVRDMALTLLDKQLSEGENIPHLAKYLSALLKSFSALAEDTSRFEWHRSITREAKQKMQRLFDAAQQSIFEGPIDVTQVELLQRAASLFDSMDRHYVLKRITSDNRSSSLIAGAVTLLETLVKDIDFDELESTELQSWLLMVFSYLTRRFSEDQTISDKTLGFTKQLGALLSGGKINISSSVPRVTLNAALEAGLQKHIHVPEIVYFVAVVVSQLPAKLLDLAKLLQIVLGHPQNPLLLRDSYSGTQEISRYTAYLVHRLFSMAKPSQSTVTTLDGVLGLYHGSNNATDTALLDIIKEIEGHLGRSLATKIVSWSVVENAKGNSLISRTRGKLALVVDAKTLAKSIFQSSPTRPAISRTEFESLSAFMALAKGEDQYLSKTYDLEFILPALGYILFLEGKAVDVQAIIEKHCVGFAVTGLCSSRKGVRKMAAAYISSVVAKLEESTYREKTQIYHLLCAILASVVIKESEDGHESLQQSLPTIIGVFLAQAVQVLSNPGHFLYEKVMDLLLRRPFLDLVDLPFMLQFSISDFGEEYQKEIGWVISVLAAGLRTEEDLNIYRKRNIFGNCLSLYMSPYSITRIKEKIMELLWNAAAVEGGATTLITRNGVMSFIEEQLSHPNITQKDKITLKRLAARLFESSAKGHVKEWSKGNIQSHIVEGIFAIVN